jgi:acyl-CoA synthetase (AMP-forming)/AMP-acid ligase II
LTLCQGEERWSAARVDQHADALASALLAAGLGQQSKVAVYLFNCPQFVVAYLGACKVSMVPLNVNFRYGPTELLYLLDNSDAEAVVFDASFAPKLAEIRAQLPNVKLWLAVGTDVPPWASGFDTLAPAKRVQARWERSADDLLLLYTGGTTGMPKGVMWRQEDLLGVGNFVANPLLAIPPLTAPEEAGPRAQRVPRPVHCIACPLMHGTGLFGALAVLNMGGTIVLLDKHKFDAEALWDRVEHHRATRISIVGQAFALPMLEALDKHPGRWDLRSLRVIGSSGAMWSRENKQGLLRHMPELTLSDAFSSSEAMGLGTSLFNARDEKATAQFALGAKCTVFGDDGQRVTPGSGVRGRVAVTGHIPLGYYKDPVKTAQTFPTIEGKRWSLPGDYAEVNADGTLTLLGRGSQCINSAGEKVFPEEVEEALKRHTAVRDAAVVGVPDERYGERICALVQLSAAANVTEATLIAHVKAQLAAYKAPRHIFVLDELYRAPNGKLDYPRAKRIAQARWAERAE